MYKLEKIGLTFLILMFSLGFQQAMFAEVDYLDEFKSTICEEDQLVCDEPEVPIDPDEEYPDEPPQNGTDDGKICKIYPETCKLGSGGNGRRGESKEGDGMPF